jgi:hypothetical protein
LHEFICNSILGLFPEGRLERKARERELKKRGSKEGRVIKSRRMGWARHATFTAKLLRTEF